MKKLILIILLAFCLLFPLVSFAQGGFLGGLQETAKPTAINQTLTPQLFAAAVIKTLLSIVGIVFVILIIYAGASYMLSQGQEDKIKKARGIIITAIVGLMIVIGGYSIAYYVSSQLESPGNIKPAFNAACETSGDPNYYSINCCEYRFQALGFIDDKCCDQTSFCNNHAAGCKTAQRASCP
jgi:hypothetical protein